MSITEQGIKGEKMARDFLIKHKKSNFQQFDWFVKDDNKYFIVEAKIRELYKPPPFLGTGLDIKQINKRKQVLNDLSIDTLLVTFTDTDIYYQWLSHLEKTIFFDTKNDIRIYDLKHFKTEKIT